MAIKPILPKWPGEMTDRERFVNQMHYKPVDRCFNMEFGYWNDNFRIWKMFVDNGITNNGEADIFFSFDRFGSVGGSVWLNPAFESGVIASEGKYDIIRNGDGLTAKIMKDRSDTIPNYIGSSVVTPDDWLKVKRERMDVNAPCRRVDGKAIAERHPKNRDYPLSVNCGSMIGKIRDMLTLEGLAYACCDYPEMVEDMIETCCVLVENFLDQVLPYVDFDCAGGWEDICCKSGPLVTMQVFNDMICPRYKRINDKLKQYGIDIWYTDCDGDVRPLMKGFMENGINCLFPFEVNSCAHPVELLSAHGRELRIMGGVDKMKLVGRDNIDAYLDSITPAVERGGYIPFCDHRCPPNVTEEDYMYYLARKKELFCRPLSFAE